MAKEFLVEGALCICKFGSGPGKLKVIDNTFFKANGNKLVGTSQTLGNAFEPPGFGICKVNPMAPKPCSPSIVEWSGFFPGLRTMAGANPLTDESKATCASGCPQCIEHTMTGQLPIPGKKNIQEATSGHQSELDPMGEASGLTEHQIEFNVESTNGGDEDEIEIESIKILTELDEGSENIGLKHSKKPGMIYDKTYDIVIESYKNNKKIDNTDDIRWEFCYEDDEGSVVIGTFKSQKGEKVSFKVDDVNLLGKNITFYSYINDKDKGAKLEVWIHYAFRYFDVMIVEKEAEERINKPYKINQGNSPLCGMACIFYLMAQNDSDGYLKFIKELHKKGKATYNGYKVEPYKGLIPVSHSAYGGSQYMQVDVSQNMYAMDPNGSKSYTMPYADWISMATLRSKESTNVLLTTLIYEGKKETYDAEQLFAVNWPGMMEKLCKKFLGYKSDSIGLSKILIQQKKRPLGAKIYDYFFDSDLKHLKNINDSYNKGNKIIMMIDSQMFDDKVSYSYIDIFNELHWVVYEGGLKFFDESGDLTTEIGKAEYVSFKIFTWGENIEGSIITRLNGGLGIRTKSFKSTFFGYIECEKI